MKNCTLFLSLLGIIFLSACTLKTDAHTVSVLQLNVWHQGTAIPNGFDAVVDQIIDSNADIVTLSEVGPDFSDKVLSALKAKGKQYYSFSSQDSGVISRFPIESHVTVFPNKNSSNSINKAIVQAPGSIIAVYTLHLDYKYYACYLPRGYDGYTWKKLDAPVMDVEAILANNLKSFRDEQIMVFLADAEKEIAQGNLVILGGDFNEPSYRDWSAATKDLFGHNGLVIPWQNVKLLEEHGFIDTYRERYPNPVTHPGFTFPSDNPAVATDKLTWAPLVDERERIDFIFYYPNKNLRLKDVGVFGPKSSIVKNQRTMEVSEDHFIAIKGAWPSDHKAVLATFEITKTR